MGLIEAVAVVAVKAEVLEVVDLVEAELLFLLLQVK
jgi:hypothetical protein